MIAGGLENHDLYFHSGIGRLELFTDTHPLIHIQHRTMGVFEQVGTSILSITFKKVFKIM